MTEILLKHLSNDDIDWLTTTGHHEEMPTGTVLVHPGKPSEALYIVIEGTLGVSIPPGDSYRSHSSGSGQSSESEIELTRLSSGDIVGEMTFVAHRLPVVMVKTLEKSLVLSIPLRQMEAKLKQDVSFAAHFYQAIAILLSNRVRSIDRLLQNIKVKPNPEQLLKKVFFVLGELKDSDIDWVMSAGSKEKIAAGTVLIHQGRPVDALHMLLDGTVAISICHANISPLYRTFAEKKCEPGTIKQEVARLSTGEILGEMSFLDNEHASAFVTCLEDCEVLSLPRYKLAAKLEMDVCFAARFYRALAAVVEDRLRGTVLRLASGKSAYSLSQMLDEDIEHEDELDPDVLDNTALAGARFDWILRQFRAI